MATYLRFKFGLICVFLCLCMKGSVSFAVDISYSLVNYYGLVPKIKQGVVSVLSGFGIEAQYFTTPVEAYGTGEDKVGIRFGLAEHTPNMDDVLSNIEAFVNSGTLNLGLVGTVSMVSGSTVIEYSAATTTTVKTVTVKASTVETTAPTTVCVDGYYGHECLQRCSTNCVGGFSNCDIIFGSCMSGCVAGWMGRQCDEECPTGRWGINCTKSCGQCLSGNCRHTDGVCNEGCAAGVMNTPHCDKECKDRSFGLNCTGVCSNNCKDVCSKQTGGCKYCKSGWHGEKCSLECDDGRWGENCKRACVTCHTKLCNRISGACYSHCKPGFKQTEFCDQEITRTTGNLTFGTHDRRVKMKGKIILLFRMRLNKTIADSIKMQFERCQHYN